MENDIQPHTHLEKVIAGEEQPITHLEKVIAEYGGGGGSGEVTRNDLDRLRREIDAKYALKTDIPDASNFITPSALNNYALKSETPNTAGLLTKAEADTLYALKGEGADLTNYYTKTEADEKFALKGEGGGASGTIPTKVSQLENDAGYVTNKTFASSSKAGLVKVGTLYGTEATSSGIVYPSTVNYENYLKKNAVFFIGKGTLDAILAVYEKRIADLEAKVGQ